MKAAHEEEGNFKGGSRIYFLGYAQFSSVTTTVGGWSFKGIPSVKGKKFLNLNAKW